jgi:hypothetical protein
MSSQEQIVGRWGGRGGGMRVFVIDQQVLAQMPLVLAKGTERIYILGMM